MKRSCFLIVLLLAITVGSRLALAARENSSIQAGLGSELRESIAKTGNFLSSAGWAGADGWHAVAATDVDAKVRPLRSTAGRKRLRKAAVNCIPADMCRKKKVLCGKRCYRSRSSLSHIPSNKCVVKCKKCVPTC